jgi:hypothetical protein
LQEEPGERTGVCRHVGKNSTAHKNQASPFPTLGELAAFTALILFTFLEVRLPSGGKSENTISWLFPLTLLMDTLPLSLWAAIGHYCLGTVLVLPYILIFRTIWKATF